MKLIFQTNGNQFEIQVGEFDSLLEIKEKVEEMQGIPIAKQILTVNGSTLIDDFDLVCFDIEDGSRIHLDIAADPVPPPQEITVKLKMPKPLYSMNLEVNANGTILQLKETIQVMAKIPIHRIVIRNQVGVELLDCMTLQEIPGITESHVMVEFLPATSKPSSSHPPPPTTPTPTLTSPSPSPSPSPSSSSSSSSQPAAAPMPPPRSATVGNKMSIELQYGDDRMTVEVWAEHKVKELRTKLEKMKVPEYYFIHKQADDVILKEELSFTDQNVAEGDVIQICLVTPRE